MVRIGRLRLAWQRRDEESFESRVDRVEMGARERIRTRLQDREDDLRQMIARVARAEVKDWIDTTREEAIAAASVPCADGWTDHDFNASGFCRRCPESLWSFQDRLAGLVGRSGWAAGLQVDFRTAGSSTDSLRVGMPHPEFEMPDAPMPEEAAGPAVEISADGRTAKIGPMMVGESVELAVARRTFQPCGDCLTPLTCEESDEDPRCP
jgi:hypothetical protein